MTKTNTLYPYISWIDAETTGLEASQESLLEVAVLITDTDLNIIDEAGFTTAVYYPETYVSLIRPRATPYVQEMHDKTRLWNRLPEGKTLSQTDKEMAAYIKQFIPQPKTSWLGGNSITLDRNFLQANLPETFNHLHYRSVDVTSVGGLALWWYDEQFTKNLEHSAFADIKESIAELKFLRERVFK